MRQYWCAERTPLTSLSHDPPPHHTIIMPLRPLQIVAGRHSVVVLVVSGVLVVFWHSPPPLRSGLQKSVSCPGSLSCLGVPPSLTVGAPKERVVSGVLVVSGDSPSLTVGAPKERVVSWKLVVPRGFPSLTVGAPKERVVSWEFVVPCDSPSLTVGAPKERVVSGVLVVLYPPTAPNLKYTRCSAGLRRVHSEGCHTASG